MASTSIFFGMLLFSTSKMVMSSTVSLPTWDGSSSTTDWSTTTDAPDTSTTDTSVTLEPDITTSPTKPSTTIASETSNVGIIAGSVAGAVLVVAVAVIITICICRRLRRKRHADQYYQNVLTRHGKTKQDSMTGISHPLNEYVDTPMSVERDNAKPSSFAQSPEYANVTLDSETPHQMYENMTARNPDTAYNPQVADYANVSLADGRQSAPTYESLLSRDPRVEDHPYSEGYFGDGKAGSTTIAARTDEASYYMALQLPTSDEHVYNTCT